MLRLQIFKFLTRFLVVISLAIGIAACGGGGGGGGSTPSNRVIVDGHEFNPSFYTSGDDFYVLVSYFNANGVLTSYHEVYEWEGQTPTFSDDYRYTYDGAGKLILKEHEFTYTREGLALYNHVFQETTYTYNLQKLATETQVLTAADYNNDGIYTDEIFGISPPSIDFINTYTYNSSGQLVVKDYDYQGDGLEFSLGYPVGDVSMTYEYNFSNLTKETSMRFTGDAKILVNEYDFLDRRKRQKQYASLTSLSADTPSRISDYSYDLNGNMTREEIDHGVAFTSNQTPDGFPDTIISYSYGAEGELREKSTEDIHTTFSETNTLRYLYEVIDDDSNSIPESTLTYVFWTDPVFDSGGGYPSELLPNWYLNAQTNLNDGNEADGWGVNWDGHDTGTCSTCGNMIGQINTILAGF